jgi:hypothetical protein
MAAIPHFREMCRIDDNFTGLYVLQENAFWKTLCGEFYPFSGEDRRYFDQMGGEDEYMYLDWQVRIDNNSIWSQAGASIIIHSEFAAVSACRVPFGAQKRYIRFAPEAYQAGTKVVLRPGRRFWLASGLMRFLQHLCMGLVGDV